MKISDGMYIRAEAVMNKIKASLGPMVRYLKAVTGRMTTQAVRTGTMPDMEDEASQG